MEQGQSKKKCMACKAAKLNTQNLLTTFMETGKACVNLRESQEGGGGGGRKGEKLKKGGGGGV
jgi:hypothetical protein